MLMVRLVSAVPPALVLGVRAMRRLNRKTRCAGMFGRAVAVAPFALAVLSIGAPASQSQSQSQAAAPAYEYSVVSIKPNKLDTSTGRGTMNTPDGYTARNTETVILIDYAYDIQDSARLAGVPGWVSSERYDVEAKMDPVVADAVQRLSRDDRAAARRQMLQALLADRFKLEIHRERREIQVYYLIIGKTGVLLKEPVHNTSDPNVLKGPDGRPLTDFVSMQASVDGTMMRGQAVPMSSLCRTLSRQVGRIVLDKTGLAGNFDFSLQFMPDSAAQRGESESGGGAPITPSLDPSFPSIFTAVQEQLGLKLEQARTSIEVIVIDHIEKPTGN